MGVYTTLTQDAYVLKMYGIQNKGGYILRNPVVFLQYGLIDSADNSLRDIRALSMQIRHMMFSLETHVEISNQESTAK